MWFDVSKIRAAEGVGQTLQPAVEVDRRAACGSGARKDYGFGTVVVFDIGQPERD